MANVFRTAAALACCLVFFNCASAKKAVMNSVSDMLAGYTAKGAPVKKSASTEGGAMLALTGETDVKLVADFFPTVLKLYDVMYYQNPGHIGLAVMTGSLYVMYANAFIQAEADKLPVSEFDAQKAEYARAKTHYLRGRDYILDALDRKYPGFKDAAMSGGEEQLASAVNRLTKDDVNAAYWLGAGWLGAFSLDPLDGSLLATVSGAVQILEKAAALDADYGRGSIWDILLAFYASAPALLGGDEERAEICFKESVRASGGRLPGPYVAYAVSICKPRNDADGFEEMLGKALALNPDDAPESRLAATISQQKARWLLEHKEDFFIEW